MSLVQIEGAGIDLLGVDQGRVDAVATKPGDCIVHQRRPYTLALGFRYHGQPLEVSSIAGPAGHGVTDGGPVETGQSGPVMGGGIEGFGEGDGVELPETLKGPAVDVEHPGPVPPPGGGKDQPFGDRQGEGAAFGFGSPQVLGQQMQPLMKFETGLVEGLGLIRGQRRRDRNLDPSFSEPLEAVTDIPGIWWPSTAGRADQGGLAIALPWRHTQMSMTHPWKPLPFTVGRRPVRRSLFDGLGPTRQFRA